ncbi:hypothetical protein FRC19_001644 [Serendipita sp. 401]|nr:hypothetical protein FRC19_001644 [Serendipita sp. 401]
MQGKLGHAAWRWLFYIEGSLTVAVGIIAIWVLPDFPATTSWLTPEERKLAELRMEEDAGVGDEEDKQGSLTRGFTLAMKDWKVWWMALALTSQVIGLSFNAYFPTLTATLGYNRTITLLLCAPPWGFAAIVAFIVARHSDKVGDRYWHIVCPLFVGMIGFVISLSTLNTAARYIALFLAAQSYAGFIVFFAWISNTIPRPPSKRAVALAFINAFSQLGNVAGSYCWPAQWGRSYRYSYAICLSCFGFAIFMCTVLRAHLKAENQRWDREMEDRKTQPVGATHGPRGDGTDVPVVQGSRGFRYIL